MIEFLKSKIMVKAHCPQFANKFLTPKNIWALVEHLYKITEKKYGSNHIVPDKILWINFCTPTKYELLAETCIIIRSLKGKCRSNRNVPDAVFNKHLNTSFGGNLCKILGRTIWVKPYCPRSNFLLDVWTPRNIWG